MVLSRHGENSARPALCSCARKQPPTGVFSASSVFSTTFQCSQGAQAWGPRRGKGGTRVPCALPPNMSLPPPLRASQPALPTTMWSFQLTTDAPSPCPALKVWKVWEPTFRVSSSGGHKRDGAWQPGCPAPSGPPLPPGPGLTEVEEQRRARGAFGPPGAQEHAAGLLLTAALDPRGAHRDGHAVQESCVSTERARAPHVPVPRRKHPPEGGHWIPFP